METYSLALALEDFVPVIFSSLGIWFISQMVLQIDDALGRMAQTGWLLITIGGSLKAVWKLLMALSDTQINIVFFDKSLFVWMGVGFVLMSYAVSYALRVVDDRNPRKRVWLWPRITIVVFFAGGFATGFPDLSVSTWRFLFLGMLTIANVVLAVLLIRRARRLGMPLVALLFVVNIVVVFVLSGLARIPVQSIPLQWVEQILNTIGQGAFLYAAWQLKRGIAEVR